MNGEIDALFEESVLDFLGEKALAADFGERPIQDHVAGRLDDDDLERGLGQAVGSHEASADFMGLGEREGGTARSDADVALLQGRFSRW
jgi:hypothetical protein